MKRNSFALVLGITIMACTCARTSAQAAPESGGGAKPADQLSKEQVEELKHRRDLALQENALIAQVQEALRNQSWDQAVGPLQQLIALEPANCAYYSGLGDAQLNLKQYEDAAGTYSKGVQCVESAAAGDANSDPAKSKALEAKMLTNLGSVDYKLRKTGEAVAAYTRAASLDPNPGTAYFNLCAMEYNIGDSSAALDACRKAIEADPTKADAYFITGSVLMGDSHQDHDGKLQAPPGTAEALQKYLELAPDGPHAKDVKEMLAYIGASVGPGR